jgi:hypothetical protein
MLIMSYPYKISEYDFIRIKTELYRFVYQIID